MLNGFLSRGVCCSASSKRPVTNPVAIAEMSDELRSIHRVADVSKRGSCLIQRYVIEVGNH